MDIDIEQVMRGYERTIASLSRELATERAKNEALQAYLDALHSDSEEDVT